MSANNAICSTTIVISGNAELYISYLPLQRPSTSILLYFNVEFLALVT